MHYSYDAKLRSGKVDADLLPCFASGGRRDRLAGLDMAGYYAQASVFVTSVAPAQEEDRIAAKQEHVYGYWKARVQ